MPHQRRSSAVKVAAVAVIALLGTACGAQREASPPPAPAPSAAVAYPSTVTADNGPVTVPAKPTRIVSLSPTATEMLFAIGAGSQVTAVDSNSNFPPGVPTTKLSAYDPNLEAILGYQPDLVVASNDAKDLLKGLATARVPTVLLGSTNNLDGTYQQLELLGTATDHTAASRDVVTGMQTRIKQLVTDAPKPAQPLSYYYELDPSLYTATSASFVGSLFGMVGLRNIADAAGTGGNAYPQLSAEYLAAANPNLVFLADAKCCGVNPVNYAARPGNATAAAVTSSGVVPLDDDIASRWGPRVVELLSKIIDALRAHAGG